MIFLINIVLLLVFAFYAGIFCVKHRTSLGYLFLGFNLPFAVMVLISWMYQAPWFWYIIQWFLQVLVLFAGIYFQENRKKNERT